jgi:hypothetical protein
LALATDKVGLDLNRPGLEVVVNEDLDLHRSDEDVALATSVLTNGLFEFG